MKVVEEVESGSSGPGEAGGILFSRSLGLRIGINMILVNDCHFLNVCLGVECDLTFLVEQRLLYPTPGTMKKENLSHYAT